jgi:hypothetical protein
VTLRVGKPAIAEREQPAAIERAAVRAQRGSVLLLDWVADAAAHPEWFQPDGLYLTLPGVAAFNGLLARALAYAYLPCPPMPRAGPVRNRRATDRAYGTDAIAARRRLT